MKRRRIPSRELLIAVTAIVFVVSLFYVGLRDARGGIDPKSGLRHGTMRMLLSDKAATRCEIDKKSDRVDIRGTIYAGNGMLRADLESTVKTSTGGRVLRQHMILDERFYYAWSDDALLGEGVTSLRQAKLSETKRDPDEPFFPFMLDHMLELDCTAWNIEKMRFVAPKNIEFHDAASIGIDTQGEGASIGPGEAGANYKVPNPFVVP